MAKQYKQKVSEGTTGSEARTWSGIEGETLNLSGRRGWWGGRGAPGGHTKKEFGWRPLQGKWGWLGRTKPSAEREKAVIEKREKIQDEAKDIRSEQFTYKSNPYDKENYSGQGLAQGFVDSTSGDLSKEMQDLISARDMMESKLGQYLGGSLLSDLEGEHGLRSDEFDWTSTMESQLDDSIKEGQEGLEAADVRDKSLEELRRTTEEGMKSQLDASSALSNLEQQRISSGMAYHGGLESQRRGIDVEQQKVQRKGGYDFAEGSEKIKGDYDSAIGDLLSAFKSDVLNPFLGAREKMEDVTGTAIEGYTKDYADPSRGTRGALSDLYQTGSAFDSYRDFIGGYDQKFKLGHRGDYIGGAAGDILETAKYEAGRSKENLAKEFPTLSQILKKA
ncbi:MAG: hypothetical protein Unbinned3849contig1000_3 [Prokaryotic dsDNA virus sp.]|nr:MAG: hypothetical protein Unbinned3849contig1000_3 [Prokaryotic dsDNA virus sp.]|tara:strand:- start:556 stop:1728 length:1173 start_codon:yes stop_codon:yes gene_type:complete